MCVCACVFCVWPVISKLHTTLPLFFFFKPGHLFVCCTTTTKKGMTHPCSSVLYNTHDYLWFCTFGSIQEQIDGVCQVCFLPLVSLAHWVALTRSGFRMECDTFCSETQQIVLLDAETDAHQRKKNLFSQTKVQTWHYWAITYLARVAAFLQSGRTLLKM